MGDCNAPRGPSLARALMARGGAKE